MKMLCVEFSVDPQQGGLGDSEWVKAIRALFNSSLLVGDEYIYDWAGNLRFSVVEEL
jgi:hypothetical protein